MLVAELNWVVERELERICDERRERRERRVSRGEDKNTANEESGEW
jgi:hypothetical protein